MSTPAKCPRCNGWGIELGGVPMQLCGMCGGSGKPPAAIQPERQTEELLNGQR